MCGCACFYRGTGVVGRIPRGPIQPQDFVPCAWFASALSYLGIFHHKRIRHLDYRRASVF